ncbi:MAG: hypothetical protein KVP17_002721 [Porospora cf. gigantea B]|uniref:uncharacterized protein n=1 Tax=Porospora cf. gigantea B TaxID=2853592 RepID=UPI003571DAC2|nr:MAG: hypothetical protein KVP17_002721 [Porospora cf. gigantea B]
MLTRLPLIATLGAAAIDSATLRIVHWNDQHAHWAQYHQQDGSLCRVSDKNTGDCIGGVPRLSQFIENRRQQTLKDAESKPTGMFVINAGDEMQGTPLWSGFGKDGEVLQAMWPFFKSDVFVVGNHEFDNGQDNLGKLLSFIQNSGTNVLCANCKFDSGSCAVPGVKAPFPADYARYCYKDNGEGLLEQVADCATADFRLGAIGIVLENMLEVAKVVDKDCEFLEPVSAIKGVLDSLEPTDFDGIVLVTHTDIDIDMEISRAVFNYRTSASNTSGKANAKKVMAIFSGHSHTMMCDGGEHWGVKCVYKAKDGSFLEATYPMMTEQIPLYQDYKWSRTIGEVLVDFTRQGGEWTHAVRSRSDETELSDMVNASVQAADAKEAISPYMNKLETLFNDQRCTATESLFCDSTTLLCGTGVVAADAMLSYKPTNDSFLPQVSLSDATKKLPQGPVTWGNLAEAFPYVNFLTYVKVSGRNLVHNIEWGLQKWGHADFRFSFSGFRILNAERATVRDYCGAEASRAREPAHLDSCGNVVYDDRITVQINQCLAAHLQTGQRYPYPDFDCNCWTTVLFDQEYSVVTHHYIAGDPLAGTGGWGYCWKVSDSSKMHTDHMTVFDNIIDFTKPNEDCEWTPPCVEARFGTDSAAAAVAGTLALVASLFVLL